MTHKLSTWLSRVGLGALALVVGFSVAAVPRLVERGSDAGVCELATSSPAVGIDRARGVAGNDANLAPRRHDDIRAGGLTCGDADVRGRRVPARWSSRASSRPRTDCWRPPTG